MRRPPAPPEGALHRLEGAAMGTGWSVAAVGVAAPPRALVQDVLDLVVAQMSAWEADSVLSRFNCAPAGEGVALPAEMLAVVRCALHVAALSDGAFDPTLGDVADAWGFGPSPVGPPPAARPRPGGWRRLRLDGRTLVQAGGLTLDLNAVAKGYAVDAASEALAAAGWAHHLVEVGGELRGAGVKPDGQPWWVEVEAPRPAAAPAPLLALSGWSVATSGDYRRWRTHAGVHHPHTLDPAAGAPLTGGPAAVTVVHRSAMWADALATALMVLGPARGLRLADQQGWIVRISAAEGAGARHHESAAWRAMRA